MYYNNNNWFIYLILIFISALLTTQVLINHDIVVDPIAMNDIERNVYNASIINAGQEKKQVDIVVISDQPKGVCLDLNGVEIASDSMGHFCSECENGDVITISNSGDADAVICIENDDMIFGDSEGKEYSSIIIYPNEKAVYYLHVF